MKRSAAQRVAEAVREGGRQSRMSIRELARLSDVSPAQVNRLRAAQVERPSLDTLVRIARALGRNPNLLFVASEHVPPEEAREMLLRVFRDRSEQIEVWKWLGRDVTETRAMLTDPATSDSEIRELALEIFLGPESEENLWSDPYLGSVVSGEDASAIRELLQQWVFLSPSRKQKVVDYVRDQADLARREQTDEIRKEIPDYGQP